MYYFITVLIIICSILLVIAVLLQNSKGGGLVSGMGSTTQMMGVRRAADFLEKATWYMAIALLVLSVIASMSIDRGTVEDPTKSKLEEQINMTQEPSNNANFPTEAPTEEGQE
ncbi:MAG: preprotein translocase subunit SecG [Bacteroidetes bacterium HGW-Bacteroidetes-21]|nr:MAG: preprotein translocase subunit SecG [Bacteroidetes bacterium HGW-Bacteroidetes-21]